MFFTFPDQFVFWRETPPDEHQALKDKILPEILKWEEHFRSNPNTSSWDSKLSCSIGHNLEFLFSPDVLKTVVWDPMDAMFSENKGEIYAVPVNSTASEIWFNITDPGEYQEVHAHPGYSFCGIYLLDCKDPNPTSFYRPTARREAYSTFTTGFMEEGTAILFPSDLAHYVKPTLNRRVTLAFNVSCTFSS